MSPSLVSSDSHDERSNTSSPSDAQPPNHANDALPMITTSLFESTVRTCGQNVLSLFRDPSTMCTVPQPASGHWPKPASPLSRPLSTERLYGLAASRAGENTLPSAPGISSFTSNLAVPVQAYGGAGSPFSLSPAPALHSNRRNNLGVLDEHSSTYTAFALTRSRAVKVRKHPTATFLPLRSVFDLLDETNQPARRSGESFLSVWTLKDLSTPDEVWVVFKSHHDACIFLSLSLPSFTAFPALEGDLEPFEKLHRVDLSNFPPLPVTQPESKSHRLRMSISSPDFHNHICVGRSSAGIQTSPVAQADNFVISSNPPNPRTTFRVGDWICNSVTCAAHNFGRNLACRGCGCPRSESQASSMNRQALGMSSARLPTSPRFASPASNASLYTGSPIPVSPHYPTMQHTARYPLAAQPVTVPKPASPSHPLLTPSGRSFAVGGKVQNISSDPSVPCIMYWPDNESFPDQGQIRPSNLSGFPQPPILNTGNRGPIEHQPGDWICKKCNYLNWRRRKVCQTCFPYAEGNGDSISAAVQSERINLLTSLLAQNQLPLRATSSSVDIPRPSTVAQVQHQAPPEALTPSSRHTRPHIDLCTAARYPDSQFIYETSGPHQTTLPAFPNMRELEDMLPVGAPAPLLPSFLQDIVRSPTLSPTSTSSADLSVEEYDDISPSPRLGRDRVVARDDSGSNYPLGNIWRLNDEETTNMAGIALPHHEDLVASRKSSQEFMRRQSP